MHNKLKLLQLENSCGQTLPMQRRTDQANPERRGDAISWRRLYAAYLPESGSTTAEIDVSYSPYRVRGAGTCRAPLGGWVIAAASVGKDI